MFNHIARSTFAPTDRNSIVLGIASTHFRVPEKAGLPTADARILSVLETVLRNLEKRHPVRQLAARMRLSPSRFEHLFRKATGQGFKAFLRSARLAKAEIMLQDPTLRVKEVAAAVGYLDPSDFIRDFKKCYGQTPSQSRSPSRSRFD